MPISSPDQSGLEKIAVLSSQQQAVPLQLPLLWPGISSMGLYQDPESSSSSWSGAGDAFGGVHRQHSPDSGDQGETLRAGSQPNLSTPVSGFHNQHGENSNGAYANLRVPCFHAEHESNGAQSPTSKDKELGGVPETARGGASLSPRLSLIDWQNECSKLGDSASFTVLQIPANGPDNSIESVRSGLQVH